MIEEKKIKFLGLILLSSHYYVILCDNNKNNNFILYDDTKINIFLNWEKQLNIY